MHWLFKTKVVTESIQILTDLVPYPITPEPICHHSMVHPTGTYLNDVIDFIETPWSVMKIRFPVLGLCRSIFSKYLENYEPVINCITW